MTALPFLPVFRCYRPAPLLRPAIQNPPGRRLISNKNAGTGKTLTPAGAVLDGNSGNNYEYTFVPNITGAITQRAITVTAMTDTKTYDGTTASSAAPHIAPDLVGTDTPSLTQAFNTPDAGINKTITPSGTVNDGNGGLNYSITFTPIHTGVINKANTVAVIISHLPTPSLLNQAVTVTFTANGNFPNSPKPTGNVTISDSTVSCTASVAAGTCTLTFTTLGHKTLTASYAGDTNFNSSVSAGVSHNVVTLIYLPVIIKK